MQEHNSNGWVEYKERVLYQLEQLGIQQDKMNEKLDVLVRDVTVLKVKSWAFGMAAGFIVTVVVNLMFMLLGHGKIV